MSRGLFTRLRPLCPVLGAIYKALNSTAQERAPGAPSNSIIAALPLPPPTPETGPLRSAYKPFILEPPVPPQHTLMMVLLIRRRCHWQRPSPKPPALHKVPPTEPPATPLTGWGRCAIAANWELVLESGQSAWRGEAAQHRREEEGVGGHRVAIEVPSPRCWAGTAVAGHAKQPQSEGQADSLAGGSGGLQAAPPRGMGPGPRGVWVVGPPPPFCPGAAVQGQQANLSVLDPPLKLGAGWVGGCPKSWSFGQAVL